MFINCPHCKALVATDPATDLPPPRCPRCAVALREEAPPATASPLEAATSAAPREPAPETVPEAPIVEAVEAVGADADTSAVAEPALDPLAGAIADAVVDAPVAQPADAAVEPGPAPAAAPVARPAGPGAPDGPGKPGRPAKATPSFARRRAPVPAPASRRPWLMPAAIAGLALLLAAQWLLADRARLAADPGWRPVVATACNVLGCSLPPWREPTAFNLLDRDVRPHPARKGVLQVSASFRNDAAWPQPWPEMVLTLSDVDGGEIAARGFTAAEYLGAPPGEDALASGQAATIRMEVLEPSPRAVAFAFDFR